MPKKLDTLLDQKLPFGDLPTIGPVSAGQLRDYVAGCQPPMPSEQQVDRMISRIAIAMPSPKISDEEACERLALYGRALRAHALPDLHDAFDIILRQCRFFPTIAEIEEIIAPIRAKRMARANRADMLIMKHDREWVAPVPNGDEVDVSELVAETLAAHPSKR